MTAPLRERLEAAKDEFPEINMGNYSEQNVEALNNWGIETYGLLTEALATLAEREKDAERLEFVVGCSRAMGLKMDGMHNWSTMYPSNVRGPNLRAAIDAAIKEKL